jgi:hypothetical protein
MPTPTSGEFAHPCLEVHGCLREDEDIESDLAILLLDSFDFDYTRIDSSLSAYHVKAKPHDGGGAVISPDADLVEGVANEWLEVALRWVWRRGVGARDKGRPDGDTVCGTSGHHGAFEIFSHGQAGEGVDGTSLSDACSLA